MKHTPYTLALATAATVVMAAFTACKPSGPDHGQGGMPPPFVVLASPEEKSISEWDEFTGRLDAIETVEVRPRISGHLQDVRIHAGQLIKKDDVLFVIDPRWNQAAYELAEANQRQAEARLQTAEREARRVDELEKSRAISAEEAETRRNGLIGAQAAVNAAKAALNSAKLDLEFTEVKAPISGRVSRAMLTTGNHVSGVPGFTTLLTTIVSQDPIYMYAAVDEARFQKYQRAIAEGKMADFRKEKVTAEVKLDGDEGFPHKGFIESFDNKIDAATGSIVLRVTVPNPQGLLTPGSFARVRIPGSPSYKALLVDEKIIRTDQSVKFVFTATPGKEGGMIANVSPLELGPMIGTQRVVKKGLTLQDKVITTNLQMVIPGAPVMPAPSAPPQAQKTAGL